jgi:hypothetical protein
MKLAVSPGLVTMPKISVERSASTKLAVNRTAPLLFSLRREGQWLNKDLGCSKSYRNRCSGI